MRTVVRLAFLLVALFLGLLGAAPDENSEGVFEQYAVASGHPAASEIGGAILAQGGSAADAVAATMLALGMAQPGSSGIGGGGFALYWDADKRSLTFLDFRERAPAAASPDMFKEEKTGECGDTRSPADGSPCST